MAFVWGVHGAFLAKIVSTDDLFPMVEEALLKHELVEPEDLVVVTAGIPTLRRGTTNMVKVHRVGANSERVFRREN
jgi:pyruvate kinase